MRPLLLALLFAVPAAAQDTSRRWTVSAFAGAGFAGLPIAEVLELPGYDLNGPRPDLVKLRANLRREWVPVVSTGALFGYLPKAGIGFGLGTHMIFIPPTGSSEVTRPVPGATLHIGSQQTSLVVGWAWLEGDKVIFPDGAQEFFVPSNQPIPDFVARGAGNRGALVVMVTGSFASIGGGNE